METVLLWFISSLFMDFMKNGLGQESLQIHFFLLIIALLDLGGIRFLLSCCVLHFLGFFDVFLMCSGDLGRARDKPIRRSLDGYAYNHRTRVIISQLSFYFM